LYSLDLTCQKQTINSRQKCRFNIYIIIYLFYLITFFFFFLNSLAINDLRNENATSFIFPTWLSARFELPSRSNKSKSRK
jgi:hypothetical protein